MQLSRVLQLQQQITELKSSLESAQQQAQARTRFLADVSHEIRTPLHSVVGFSELSTAVPARGTFRAALMRLDAQSAAISPRSTLRCVT